MLTDGRNYLWVYVEDNGVSSFTRYMPNGAPGKILDAISDAFDVDIVSEREPQYWGFDTQEEWDAAMEALTKEDEEKFHAEVLKFLNREPHEIRQDTIGMLKAEIAKRLVEEDPTLLLPTNKRKFRDAIEMAYDRDYIVTLGPGHLPF
jgi:hypothetical protein